MKLISIVALLLAMTAPAFAANSLGGEDGHCRPHHSTTGANSKGGETGGGRPDGCVTKKHAHH